MMADRMLANRNIAGQPLVSGLSRLIGHLPNEEGRIHRAEASGIAVCLATQAVFPDGPKNRFEGGNPTTWTKRPHARHRSSAGSVG